MAVPQYITVPETVTTPPASSSSSSSTTTSTNSGGTTSSSGSSGTTTPVTASQAGLLDRTRGILSTVLTGFDGILTKNTVPQGKSLLGE